MFFLSNPKQFTALFVTLIIIILSYASLWGSYNVHSVLFLNLCVCSIHEPYSKLELENFRLEQLLLDHVNAKYF